MWRTTLSSLRAHKRRLLGTCLAVVLGVAFVSGTLVLGDSTRAGFGDLFSEANEGTDALVRSSSEIDVDDLANVGSLDESIVDTIGQVDGVAAAAPEIEGSGQVIGADGDPLGGNGPPTIAGNWITDPALNPFRIVDGRAPETADEVVIDKATADLGDLHRGDTVTVRVPEPLEVTITGIAKFGSEDGMAGATYAGFTTEAAQDLLFTEPGQITSVRVAADDGVSQSELVDRITPLLPADTEALTGTALTAEQQDEIEGDFLGAMETFLLVFAGIALVVAGFSIYNTFSIVVAQRSRESALLRALGASRRQVLVSTMAESLLVGLVASGLGLLAGVALATGLSSLMDGLGFGLPTGTMALNSDTIITGMALGVIVTVAASVGPAIKASQVLPLAALRDVAIDRSSTSRVRLVAGAVVAAAGVGLTVAGATAVGSLSLTGLGALALLVGVVMLGPVAARPASAALGTPIARLRGVSGELARGNAMRNPKRTAGTASALMVGVAVVAMFTVIAASLKAYIDETVDKSFAGDLVMATDNFSTVGMSTEVAPEVAALPEVASATPMSNASLRIEGEDQFASAVDGPGMEGILDIGVAQGSLADLGPGTVALSTDYAGDLGLSLGDPAEVAFADGSQEQLTVAAVFDDADLVGPVLVNRETWLPHVAQPADTVVMIELADGVGMDDGEQAVQAVADRFHAPDAQTRQEYIDAVAGQVDQFLTVIYVLLMLAIVIALMGIANTLSLSIHERARELGLLRAVGQSRRQLRSMIRGESVLVATFGAVGGIGLGVFLGWALMKALGSTEEDLSVFALPVGQLLVVLALGALVGVIAAWRPARRASKLDILDAIATD